MYLLRNTSLLEQELLVNTSISQDGKTKHLKTRKYLESILTINKKNYLMIQNKRDVNNRPVGLLANGVELFPPTVFDEQIFHGDITEIKVTNPGKDYDVITGPPLIINDQQGFGALLVMLTYLDHSEKLNWFLWHRISRETQDYCRRW